MSERINDGGPAFPMPDTVYPNGQVQAGSPGMTLRAWLAGKALSGYCVSNPNENSDKVAQVCVEDADALFAELEKTK